MLIHRPASYLVFCVAVAWILPCAGVTHAYSIIAVQETPGRVTIIDSEQPVRRASVSVGFKPHEVAVSQDGKTAFVSNFGLNDADNRDGIAGSTISAIDIASATLRAELRLPDSLKAPHGLAMRPGDRNELFTNAEQGDRMVVFDGRNAHVMRTFSLPAGIHNFVFSKAGTEIFAFTPQGVVFRLNADSGGVEVTRDFGRPVRGLAWGSDHRHLLVSSRGAIELVDAKTLATQRRFLLPTATQSFYCAESPDGRFVLAPAVFAGEVTVFDARTGSPIEHLHTGTPLRVLMSPDGERAYVANVSARGKEISVIDMHSFAVTHIPGLEDVNGLALSPILYGRDRAK